MTPHARRVLGTAVGLVALCGYVLAILVEELISEFGSARDQVP